MHLKMQEFTGYLTILCVYFQADTPQTASSGRTPVDIDSLTDTF